MVFVIYVLDNLQKQQIALQTPSRNESLSMKAKKGTWELVIKLKANAAYWQCPSASTLHI